MKGRTMCRSVVRAAAVMVAAWVWVTPGLASGTTLLQSNGRIVFASHIASQNGPSDDIVTINPDGTGLVNLTPDSPHADAHPSWSPDGAKIAFDSTREDANFEIYVMNADGTGVQRLTTSPGADFDPSWSPDGTRIVFASRRTGDLEIFTMNADGSQVEQLTFEPGPDSWPKWSPDGTTIALTGVRGQTSAVYTIPATGGALTKLTPDFLNAAEPDWSPDGSRFVFVNNFCLFTFCPSSDIFTMNVDGSNIVQLTQGVNALNPNWSPDGTKIDFWTLALLPASETAYEVAFIEGLGVFPITAMLAGDIWTMNADGTGFTNVTNSPGRLDWFPDWGPAFI
jgi:Tol biopolymer transport system component